ncbi:peptidase inhibitor family I36 protein [Streptomyces sp. SP18CS02]|uniref:peptidase inhibitor family I36 protein n=1 Tax=Streptomyces sp. SP18CS02 TaxID=3002531 RepID=UPI002E76B75F|nr:peptidase inhibitor family I36 protein [Streptomyces sp. SP18CS02]MEE1753369.1 peptidase inhibitor family I36 protein [Streptomyces sp. SP18CS02]
MIRKTIASAVAATGLIAGSLLLAAPAQAAPSDCASGNFCMWTDYNNVGQYRAYSYHKDPVPAPLNNNDRSSYNRMSQAGMELYSGTGYSGYMGCSRPGARWTHHSPERTVESIKKVSSCG